uniref:Uncharacterized protein n=1 Tax=Cannabis sativa TaxID=3483 RepID=A0A803PIU3_CANSA
MTELPFPTTTKISSLQAVMAHLWVSITRNRNLKPEQEVSYSIVMGLRQRMEPPLAEGYFGNAVVFGRVETTAGKLVEKNGLGWAVFQMNIMIGSYTTEKVNEYLKSWAESPKLATFTAEPGFGLMTGSSPRFNVYGNDFGWGKPVCVRSGKATKYDGKLTVFPGVDNGSVDFEVCLRAETLESMAYDQEFLDTLSM